MSQITEWTIPGADGQPIYGNTHWPHGPRDRTLIICHGFKGYKDYGFFPCLAQRAAHSGLVAHRFNFSHSGMTNRLETFQHPHLFEQDTWSKQVFDLQQVATAAQAGQLPDAAPCRFVAWFGHSRGGVPALLTAARGPDAAPDRIVTAAAPHSAANITDEHRQLMQKQGWLDSPSSRTGQNLRIGRAWLEDIDADPKAVDPLAAIKKINCPVLIVHGSGDQTVPVDSAHMLQRAGGDHARLEVIADASHTFNASNPMDPDAPPDAVVQLADQVCQFCQPD